MARKENKDNFPEEEAFVLVDRVLSPYLVAFHRPQSFYAEQYRGLRNKIVAMNKAGTSKSILITSAMTGDGKTVTLANLGLVMGELERTRVLMIDADLRHPGLESALGFNRGPGLTDLLMDKISLEEAIRDSGFPQVNIMGAGSPIENPSGLLTSGRVKELLKALKERYNYILLDSPPVLPITDAVTLSTHCDGVILVVKVDYTPRPAVDKALSLLKGVGAAILGVFLTCIKGMDEDRKGPYYYPYGPKVEE